MKPIIPLSIMASLAFCAATAPLAAQTKKPKAAPPPIVMVETDYELTDAFTGLKFEMRWESSARRGTRRGSSWSKKRDVCR